MIIDFTFKNSLIKEYFEGDDSYIPSSELMYLHEHPLVKESFLIEIERMINEVAVKMSNRNMQGPVVEKFVASTIALGAELPNVTKQNAPKILSHLRDIYKLCKGLLN
jgi:hypothetical protein